HGPAQETNLGIATTMKRIYAARAASGATSPPPTGRPPRRRSWRARDGAALVVGRRIPRRDPAARVLIAELYSAGLQLIFRPPVGEVRRRGALPWPGAASLPCRGDFFE